MRKGHERWMGRPPRLPLAGVTFLVGLVSCVPLDRPARLPNSLPEALLAYLSPDTVRTRSMGEGLSYHYLWSSSGPWAVHMLSVDLERCDLGLAVLPAGREGPAGAGLATVTSLVRRAGDGVLAAVNGDFFTLEGWPVGPEVARGRLLRSRSRPAFSWAPGARPWIGTAEVRGVAGLEAGSWIPTDEEVSVQVIGGFPELLDRGEPVMARALDVTRSFASFRHPRTAVGYDPVASRLWLLVVDGRQGSYSSGMTLVELTALLVATGATEALNLDGGGSSVMVVGGRTRSRPSDEDGERAVRNALAVVRDDAYCRETRPPVRSAF